MEAPSELAFVDASLVHDVPTAALLVDVEPGQPSFFNFEVKSEQLISQLAQTIKDTTDQRRIVDPLPAS